MIMELSEPQQLALSRHWLLEAEAPLVQRAISAAYAVTWSGRVKQQFARNYTLQQADSGCLLPTSWAPLGRIIGVDPKHASRYAAHKNDGNLRSKLLIPDTLLRYRIAVALGTTEERLSPSSRQWIAGTAKWLVLLSQPEAAGRCDACHWHALADYLLAAPETTGPQLCPRGLGRVRRHAAEDAERAARQEAQRIDRESRELEESEGNDPHPSSVQEDAGADLPDLQQVRQDLLHVAALVGDVLYHGAGLRLSR